MSLPAGGAGPPGQLGAQPPTPIHTIPRPCCCCSPPSLSRCPQTVQIPLASPLHPITHFRRHFLLLSQTLGSGRPDELTETKAEATRRVGKF